MGKLTKSCLVIVTVFLASCLTVGSATAVTVRVETSSGATTSATYYIQEGDWATGDAMVSSTGDIKLSTSGYVEKGLVTAGGSAFTPYTGDFSATASAGADGASTTASFSNPRVDIFVVTQPGNSTIDGYGGATYNAFHGPVGIGAVDTADAEGGNPDWILVDRGTYGEQVNIAGYNGTEANSALTSVWGVENTIIERTNLVGPGVDVRDTDGFRIEGFTVQGGIKDGGIDVDNSPNVQIIGNTVTDRVGDGIQVTRSDNAQIVHNTTTNNQRNGINVTYSDGSQISSNIVANNQWNGIKVDSSAGVQIIGNSITGNGGATLGTYGGVYLEDAVPLATINGNNISGNQNYGLWNNTDGFVVDATNNWWGQSPATYRGNLTVGAPAPSGADIWDASSNAVDYQPFAVSPFPLL